MERARKAGIGAVQRSFHELAREIPEAPDEKTVRTLPSTFTTAQAREFHTFLKVCVVGLLYILAKKNTYSQRRWLEPSMQVWNGRDEG